MNKILMVSIITMLSLVSAQAALACTQEEATAKMGKIFQSPEYQALTGGIKTAEDAAKVTALNQKVNDAGKLLAEQKRDEACAKYDEVIKEIGIK